MTHELAYLAAPLFLDSRWAFLPAVLLTILLVTRTALEDGVLQEELAGYRDYARRVRFGFSYPMVWMKLEIIKGSIELIGNLRLMDGG